MTPSRHPASRFATRTLLLCVGVVGTAAAALAQAPPTAFWDLSLSARGAWYSNPNFTQTAPDVLSSRAGVGLGYSRSTTAGEFTFSASAAAAFDNQPTGSDLNYSGQLAWRRQLGPRTSLQLRDSLTQSYSQSTPMLLESGLVYPYTLIRTNDASASLSHQLTTKTSFSVSGRHRWAQFPGSQLPSGQRVSMGVGFGRTLSEVDNAGLSYTYGWDDTQGASYGSHGMAVSWSRRLGAATSGSVSVGGSYWSVLPEGSSQWILTASASLSGQRGRTGYGLTYSRSPELVYGLARERIADVLSGTLSRQLTRIMSGSVGGVWSRGRDVLDPTYTYDTQSLYAGLQVQPRPTFTIGGGYSWTRLALNGEIQNSHSFDLAVSYGWRWR